MKFVVICALIGCTLAVNKVPLKRVKSVRERLTDSGEYGAFKTWKNRQQIFNQFSTQFSLPLKDYSEITYIAQVQLGTPPQTFNVIPDTGSSDLWIPDYTCTHSCPFFCNILSFLGMCKLQFCDACACHTNSLKKSVKLFGSSPCDGKDEFSSKKSSTYKTDGSHFSIQYGTGSCSGFLGKDDLIYGGIKVSQQTFGQATSLASFFAGQPFDGILGMAYPALASSGATPVFNMMMQQNAVDQPVFGVYMTEGGGELTLGGFDDTKYTGAINYVPIDQQGYWQYNIDGVSINGKQVSNGGRAISDTGTSLLAGPSTVVNAIGNALGGTYDYQQELYEIDCNKQHDDIVLTIGGNTYGVKSTDYTLKISSKCYLGFQSLGFGTPIDYILGDCFHRSFYHIYDFGKNRIGLATAVHN